MNFSKYFLWLAIGFLALPAFAFADDLTLSPIASAVRLSGSEVSYGDLIDYDQEKGLYFLSQIPDDPQVFGVADENPSLLVSTAPTDVPVTRQGQVLINVTLENGPIAPGNGLISSSIPGKAMLAATTSAHVVAIAREGFDGKGSTTTLSYKGKSYAAGTILADLRAGTGSSSGYAGTLQGGCKGNLITCSIAQKIDTTPVVTLLRYIVAAAVSIGSIVLAFRTFMSNATSGVIAVGRNPRAKSSIQAMVIFNATLGVAIALVGLGAGILILVIKL